MIIENYTVYNISTGKIIKSFSCDNESLAANIPENCAAISGLYSPKDGYIKNNSFTLFPQRPTVYHTFDFATDQWIEDLTKAKTEQWKKIKESRDLAEFNGFTWNGLKFDSDAISQSRIQGAVILANLDVNNFSIVWTLADNSTQNLNGTEMISVGQALSLHIKNVHETGRLLRENINTATNVTDILNISWPTL